MKLAMTTTMRFIGRWVRENFRVREVEIEEKRRSAVEAQEKNWKNSVALVGFKFFWQYDKKPTMFWKL